MTEKKNVQQQVTEKVLQNKQAVAGGMVIFGVLLAGSTLARKRRRAS